MLVVLAYAAYIHSQLGSHRRGHSQTSHIPVYNYASSRSGIVLIKQTTLDNQSVLPSKHNISSNDNFAFSLP